MQTSIQYQSGTHIPAVILQKFILFKVETKRATPREARDNPDAGQSVKKVFVGGVSEDIEDEEIKAYFEQVKHFYLVVNYLIGFQGVGHPDFKIQTMLSTNLLLDHSNPNFCSFQIRTTIFLNLSIIF